MADGQDEEFGKALAEAFAEDENVVENPTTPEVDNANKSDPATPPDPDKVEDPKKDERTDPKDPNKKDEEPEAPSADPAKPKEGDDTARKDPEAPATPNEPKPLTKEDVASVIRDIQVTERASGQALQTAAQDVMQAYYPEGLSNVLVDQNSGKELRTPQDVVDASGGEMSMEQATQWLMNEQYKLNQNIERIQGQARQIAETTLTFKQNSIAALQKYEPLFKAYPQLQGKVFDKMMKQVKADQAKGVILSAPDPLEFYDDYLEPYQKAYEYSTNKPATAPVTSTAPTAPVKPGQSDRLDEGGDGGATTEVDDPNDFAQQVTKELAKGF